jgi:hypothetical protein
MTRTPHFCASVPMPTRRTNDACDHSSAHLTAFICDRSVTSLTNSQVKQHATRLDATLNPMPEAS